MNLSLRITTTGLLLQGKAPAVIQQSLDGFVTEVTMFLLAEVKKRTPQGVFGAQGGLLGSVQADVLGRGTPQVKGIVASAHKYVEVVEKGRTAGKGMPPKGALVRWLEVKLGLDETTARSIEYVVRRKIGRDGFKGAHMFEHAVVENIGQLDAMAARYGLKLAQELS